MCVGWRWCIRGYPLQFNQVGFVHNAYDLHYEIRSSKHIPNSIDLKYIFPSVLSDIFCFCSIHLVDVIVRKIRSHPRRDPQSKLQCTWGTVFPPTRRRHHRPARVRVHSKHFDMSPGNLLHAIGNDLFTTIPWSHASGPASTALAFLLTTTLGKGKEKSRDEKLGSEHQICIKPINVPLQRNSGAAHCGTSNCICL